VNLLYHVQKRKATYLISIFLTNKERFYRIVSLIPAETEKRISPQFKKRLNELIEDLEITKYEFSKLVKISVPVITRATIYGIIPSLRPLIKMADYFHVSLEYLLGDVDKDNFYQSDNPTTFHIRLAELTKEKETTYAEIAHRMPFTKTYFYEWQQQKTLPSLEYLIALAEDFHVSIDYLLGRTDDRHN
jgi:hypothetical protein cdifQ_04001071